MIAKSINTAAMICGGLLLSFGVVQAAPSLGSVSPVPAMVLGATPSERSPDTILKDARLTLDRMESSADSISLMLRVAREQKDVVRIICLDDKLNQMNTATRSASDRLASIEAAASSGNAERARHDDDVLAALSARGNELTVEANQCIGEKTGIVGGSKLDVTVDPEIPKAVTGAPSALITISTPPVAASPTI